MTMQSQSVRAERVEREYKKWEEAYVIPFSQEFSVRTMLDLREQFLEVDEGHTKQKQDILIMIDRIEKNLHLKPKQKSADGMKEFLFTSRSKSALYEAYNLILSLVENDIVDARFTGASYFIKTRNKTFKFKGKSQSLKGVRFDLCVDIDEAYNSDRYAAFSETLDK